jgi:sporulation protein YlmC with PRC-barrel domain
MPVNVKSLTEMFEKDVFTERGVYCGKVDDVKVDLDKFRMKAVAIEAVKGSYLAEMVGRKKGIIIPYDMIRSIGDIVIIKHITAPVAKEEEEKEKTELVE